MAHNLYQDTMAYSNNGDVPWHGLGIRFDGLMTAEQAIQAAKLDYEVKKEQLYRKIVMDNGEKFDQMVDAFATVNSATNDVLGYVGRDYTIVQNRDKFAFFDEIVGENGAIFETAGAIGNGERVWLLAKMPESFEIIAGDKINQYVLLHGTHDGTGPVTVQYSPIRVVCQNTLNLAMSGKKAKNDTFVRITHTKNASERLAEAGRILKRMQEFYEGMHEKMDRLANFCIDDDFIEDYKNKLFGSEDEFEERGRTIRLSKLQMFEGRLRNGMGVDIPGVQGTAYWALQAAIEYADYDMRKSDKTIVNDILFGRIAKFKQKSFDDILTLVS